MEKEEILNWNKKYDVDHPWWTQREKEFGDKLRRSKELTKDDLVEIVEWKFKGLPGRKDSGCKLGVEFHGCEEKAKCRYVCDKSSEMFENFT